MQVPFVLDYKSHQSVQRRREKKPNEDRNIHKSFWSMRDASEHVCRAANTINTLQSRLFDPHRIGCLMHFLHTPVACGRSYCQGFSLTATWKQWLYLV